MNQELIQEIATLTNSPIHRIQALYHDIEMIPTISDKDLQYFLIKRKIDHKINKDIIKILYPSFEIDNSYKINDAQIYYLYDEWDFYNTKTSHILTFYFSEYGHLYTDGRFLNNLNFNDKTFLYDCIEHKIIYKNKSFKTNLLTISKNCPVKKFDLYDVILYSKYPFIEYVVYNEKIRFYQWVEKL